MLNEARRTDISVAMVFQSSCPWGDLIVIATKVPVALVVLVGGGWQVSPHQDRIKYHASTINSLVLYDACGLRLGLNTIVALQIGHC